MINNLIENVASARLALDEALAVHERDTAEVTRLAARIEHVRARQTEITHARLAGESDEDQTVEYSVLGGDLAVLNDLLAEATARAKASAPDAQRTALARAEATLREAQHKAEFAAIVEHTREVERVYIECLRRVWDTARARGNARTFGEVFQIAEPIMVACRLNVLVWS
ncbi:MAG: hypothetical protein LBU72_08350 [Burkholderiaceae bacterium]|jgi:hypothetical protein|nr:hypothetical protein [Burkholderiaceae bacterium]